MASLGDFPTALADYVTSFRMVMQTNQRVTAAPGGGSEQASDMLNDRWMVYMTMAQANDDIAAEIEAFVASFRGQVNWVDLWHLARPVPRGTFANHVLAVDGAHAQGAATLNISIANFGTTYKKGDIIGVGGMLLMCSADGTTPASGTVPFPMVNRLRAALSTGAAVTTTRPKASFRLLSHSGIGYVGGNISEEVTLTFGEKI